MEWSKDHVSAVCLYTSIVELRISHEVVGDRMRQLGERRGSSTEKGGKSDVAR
jgi:hypothetical protein